jgi:hypothetical protein
MTTKNEIPSETPPDPLIDEIRAIRGRISEEFGHDVNRLVDHLREIERQFPGRVLQPTDLQTRRTLKAS